jgi:Flp pilus assembly protein TadD
MKRRVLVLALLVLVGTTTAGIYYWPDYKKHQLLSEAEHARAAGNLAKADELLIKLIRLDPGNARAHFLRAQVLRGLGQSSDAMLYLNHSAELGYPVPEGRREYGLLFAPYDFSLAEGALQKVLEQTPDDKEVLEALALGYLRTHRPRSAEKQLKHLLELEAENADNMLKLGEVYLETFRPAQAVPILRQLVRLAPGNFRARLLLGQSLMADGYMAEAEAELLECRNMRPDNPDPLVGLAACAMERNDTEKAWTLLSKAHDLDRSSTLALNDIGNLHLLRRRYDLAIQTFEAVLRLNKDDKQAHLHLAMAYRSTGKMDLAVKHQTRYQELDQAEASRLELHGER